MASAPFTQPPSTQPPSRHKLIETPVDPPVSGSLPFTRQAIRPVPAPLRPSSGYLPIQGELPVPRPSARPLPQSSLAQNSLPQNALAQNSPPQRSLPQRPLPQPRPEGHTPAERQSVELSGVSCAEPTIRRTKVTLTPAPPMPPTDEDEDVRIYLAPPLAGLSTFDLGSVPASVTPPKTWRKAAWFAAISSGGVVVALLFAGTYFVGQPAQDQASNQDRPGYRGGQAPASGDLNPDPSGSTGATTRKSGTGKAGQSSSTGKHGGEAMADAPRNGGMTPGAPATDPGGPATTGTVKPPPSTVPQKPPATPAPRVTPTTAPWYSFPPDAQAMGDNTEKFFNTVTDNPAAASGVTTGKLHDQGPQALAQRYSDVAYFEVKKISIDQSRGVTVNTVEVTHRDGTKTLEQRTLTFGDQDKIEGDGR